MRSQGTRRVAQAAGAAMIAVIALAGCSAGQVAETALLKSPVSGLNTQSPDGKLLIRNLQVSYNSPQGYPANGTAPIEGSFFNQGTDPITVTITSRPQTDVVSGVVSAQQVGLGPAPAGGSATPAPDASASAPAAPAASALQPAKFTIAPLGSETFLSTTSPTLQAAGLSNELRPGYSLSLTVQVEGAQAFDVIAPFAVPNSPAPRGSAVVDDEDKESEG